MQKLTVTFFKAINLTEKDFKQKLFERFFDLGLREIRISGTLAKNESKTLTLFAENLTANEVRNFINSPFENILEDIKIMTENKQVPNEEKELQKAGDAIVDAMKKLIVSDKLTAMENNIKALQTSIKELQNSLGLQPNTHSNKPDSIIARLAKGEEKCNAIEKSVRQAQNDIASVIRWKNQALS